MVLEGCSLSHWDFVVLMAFPLSLKCCGGGVTQMNLETMKKAEIQSFLHKKWKYFQRNDSYPLTPPRSSRTVTLLRCHRFPCLRAYPLHEKSSLTTLAGCWSPALCLSELKQLKFSYVQSWVRPNSLNKETMCIGGSEWTYRLYRFRFVFISH